VTDLLFAYGTLMRGFPLHRLIEDLPLVGEGRMTGRLLDLGSYPGAVPDARGEVRGEVYRVPDPERWRALDSTEGRQYHREEVTVRIDGGPERRAFAYWYRGSLGCGVTIPGGDYRAHALAASIHRRPRHGEATDGA
jgi:gamma-glutamylcyclotransferase (GGCT)/AIG2-like uncharacterized protein YtfP